MNLQPANRPGRISEPANAPVREAALREITGSVDKDTHRAALIVFGGCPRVFENR
jgi:hypothetical protein